MRSSVPITRLGKFFGDRDFDLEIGMGQEWLVGDMNYTCVLYKIDRNKIKTDDVYGEVVEDGIKFLPPVEFNAQIRFFVGNDVVNRNKNRRSCHIKPLVVFFVLYFNE